MNKRNWLIIGLVVLVAFGIYNNFEEEPSSSPDCTCVMSDNDTAYCGETCCGAGYDETGDEPFDVGQCLPKEGDPTSCQSTVACWQCLVKAAEACRDQVVGGKGPSSVLNLEYCRTIFGDNEDECWKINYPPSTTLKESVGNKIVK